MLPIHQIEKFLEFTSPQLQDIVLELRNIFFLLHQTQPKQFPGET